MARVEVTKTALADLERLFEFLAASDPGRALRQISSVRQAFGLLAEHPLLGRAAEQGRRELVLSRGREGYIAKYRYVAEADVVFILAVKHQREAGYSEET